MPTRHARPPLYARDSAVAAGNSPRVRKNGELADRACQRTVPRDRVIASRARRVAGVATGHALPDAMTISVLGHQFR